MANARLVERIAAWERVVGRNSGSAPGPFRCPGWPTLTSTRHASRPTPISTAPSRHGVNAGSPIVYLLTYQHVLVGRCAGLIADLTSGTGPSSGFVHGIALTASPWRPSIPAPSPLTAAPGQPGNPHRGSARTRRNSACPPHGREYLHSVNDAACGEVPELGRMGRSGDSVLTRSLSPSYSDLAWGKSSDQS